MPQRLPRFHRQQQAAEDEQKVANLVAEAGDDEPVDAMTKQRAGSTAAGDSRRLRGVPAIGRGVQGAIVGSSPLGALIAKESRRQR